MVPQRVADLATGPDPALPHDLSVEAPDSHRGDQSRMGLVALRSMAPAADSTSPCWHWGLPRPCPHLVSVPPDPYPAGEYLQTPLLLWSPAAAPLHIWAPHHFCPVRCGDVALGAPGGWRRRPLADPSTSTGQQARRGHERWQSNLGSSWGRPQSIMQLLSGPAPSLPAKPSSAVGPPVPGAPAHVGEMHLGPMGRGLAQAHRPCEFPGVGVKCSKTGLAAPLPGGRQTGSQPSAPARLAPPCTPALASILPNSRFSTAGPGHSAPGRPGEPLSCPSRSCSFPCQPPAPLGGADHPAAV